jgi:hypothetical protein
MARSIASKATKSRKAENPKASREKSVHRSVHALKASPKKAGARKTTAAKVHIMPSKASIASNVNRLSRRLAAVSMHNAKAVDAIVQKTPATGVELVSTFRSEYASAPAQARMLAESYARSIKNPLDHRELFQEAAGMKSDERRALVAGYRRAGQARGVVHAVGQLPRAQGRVLMKDLVLHPDGKIDHSGLQHVLYWLRDAGAEIKRMEHGKPKAAPDTDSAVVDFFEDVADDIANAINSVVDAVVNATKTLGQAIADMINWAANDIANLVNALIKAGQSILNLLNAALENGYEMVKKIVAGLDAIGQGLFTVLDSAFNLAKDALVTVLKAIDNLGHTLGELLGYLAGKAFAVIKQGVDALLAIGKSIGNIL